MLKRVHTFIVCIILFLFIKEKIPIKWLAPEGLRGVSSEKSDV